MTGRKESGAPWFHTTVILQPDIYRQALERGIDISDACNRALASLTGTEYRKKEREEVPAKPPVIIARDGSSPHIAGEQKKTPVQKMPPVINADDPAAPARVAQDPKKNRLIPSCRFLHLPSKLLILFQLPLPP